VHATIDSKDVAGNLRVPLSLSLSLFFFFSTFIAVFLFLFLFLVAARSSIFLPVHAYISPVSIGKTDLRAVAGIRTISQPLRPLEKNAREFQWEYEKEKERERERERERGEEKVQRGIWLQ